MKGQKGITLIALIITIIVMLILVVVTISMAVNGDLFAKTKTASEEMQKEADKELLMSVVLDSLDDQGNLVEGTLKTLATAQGFTTTDIAFPYTFVKTATGNAFTVDSIGNVQTLQKGIVLSQASLTIAPEATGNITASLVGGLTGTPSWSSSDEEVATVSGGTVTGVSAGTATITASCNGYSATCTVTIKVPLVGKYISWDSDNDETPEDWMVLYDDSTNGLQIISLSAMDYEGDSFEIGNRNALIDDFSEIDGVDLNNDDYISEPDETEIYIYNNIITLLNQACDNIIKNRTGVLDVRCVGSVPNAKNSESGYLTNNLMGQYSGKIKDGDQNYQSDDTAMSSLGIKNAGSSYALASRGVSILESSIRFTVNYCWNGNTYISDGSLITTTADSAQFAGAMNKLRPVVTLNPNVEFSGEGTQANPYTF